MKVNGRIYDVIDVSRVTLGLDFPKRYRRICSIEVQGSII